MYYYSPHTGEQIVTDAPADWMGRTDSPPPEHDRSSASAVWRNGEWVIERAASPSLSDLQATACTAIDAERARRAVSPIAYAGSPFDADSLARERISGLILRLLRGDGLPANWIGWRGADNAMHWAALDADAVRVQISGLSSAIEDREQALLIAAWQHKSAVMALDSVEAVQGYEIGAGWPA